MSGFGDTIDNFWFKPMKNKTKAILLVLGFIRGNGGNTFQKQISDLLEIYDYNYGEP